MAEAASWKTAAAAMVFAVIVVTARASWLLSIVCFPVIALLCCYAAGLAVDTIAGDVCDELRSWRRKQAYRSLSFSTPSAWSAGLTRLSWEETSPSSSNRIHFNAPESFHESLNGLLQLVRRDFILPWYSRISPSAAFPNAVDGAIRQSLGNLADRAQRVDWATLVVSKTVPLLKEHIEHFKRVEGTLSTARGAESSIPLPPKHHSAVASHHTPSLAPAAVEAHVQKTAERLLGLILPPKDSASRSVRLMATEIVTMMILLPVIDMLSDGDFWNRLIEERGKRHLHEE
jgi:sorting nexin-25